MTGETENRNDGDKVLQQHNAKEAVYAMLGRCAISLHPLQMFRLVCSLGASTRDSARGKQYKHRNEQILLFVNRCSLSARSARDNPRACES